MLSRFTKIQKKFTMGECRSKCQTIGYFLLAREPQGLVRLCKDKAWPWKMDMSICAEQSLVLKMGVYVQCKVNSKYQGMIEVQNLENQDKFGKKIGLKISRAYASPNWDGTRFPEVSTSRAYASSKWDGARCPEE